MKVAMLMSGGVDSSVAAQLLYNAGVDFDPYYIKISMEGFDNDYSCSQEEDVEMASAVCRRFGKTLNIIDLHNEYWSKVVEYHLDRVKRGLTPNPDVMCNRLIKFGAFDEKTNHMYDKIVTGHYASTIQDEDGRTWMLTTPDAVKDQTDFLSNMTPEQVSKAWFPIGTYTKEEVRALAEQFNLAPKNRKDSQGICFLGKINYNDFIKKHLGEKKGNIVDIKTGNIIGTHNGYWFHTIGQRKGLGLSGGPWYVVKKDIDNNIVYVTTDKSLFDPSSNITSTVIDLGLRKDFNWCTMDVFPADDDPIWLNPGTCPMVYFKIRHSPEYNLGVLHNVNGHFYLKNFGNLGGIAPGQFCTLYDDRHEICFGTTEMHV